MDYGTVLFARRRDDAGLTLIELLVGMVITALLSGLSISGWASYQRANEHKGSAQELMSTLRNAQQSSLAEAVTYCVSFNTAAASYQVFKFQCGGTGLPVGEPKKMKASRVKVQAPAFKQLDASTGTTVSFFPRGSATQGSVQLVRDGRPIAYTIKVEGLTGRVSLKG